MTIGKIALLVFGAGITCLALTVAFAVKELRRYRKELETMGNNFDTPAQPNEERAITLYGGPFDGQDVNVPQGAYRLDVPAKPCKVVAKLGQPAVAKRMHYVYVQDQENINQFNYEGIEE